MTTQFDKIYSDLSQIPGKFRVAASGVGWRAGEITKAIPATDIKSARWYRVARGFRACIETTNDGEKVNFDGFSREHYDKLAALFKKHFSIDLEFRETTFKGWNWGATEFRGSDELLFKVSNKPAFELPLSNVSNVNISGKDVVSLELGPSSPSLPQQTQSDVLVEVSFYIPSSSKEEERSSSESDDSLNAAEVFHKAVKARTRRESEGDPAVILRFEDLFLLTPRGRYDMDIYSDSLRLHGKTYDYRILYSNITRIFLLPKGNIHLLFIIGLKSPIRQGQTSYHYLVIQQEPPQNMTAKLNVTEKDLEAYPSLKEKYQGPTFEIITDIFRSLTGKKIISNGSFRSHAGTSSSIKASLRAMQGDIFMLQKYIFFVTRQPILIELADIYSVAFSRADRIPGVAAAQTFDMEVVTRFGPEYMFTLISQEEFRPIEAFLKERKVKIKDDMDLDVELYSGDSGSDSDGLFRPSVKNKRGLKRRNAGKDEDNEEDIESQGSSSDSGSSTLESGSSDGNASTDSEASGDREIGRPKTIKNAKVKDENKENYVDDGARPATSATKTQTSEVKGPIYNQHKTQNLSRFVSENHESGVERPKKKLKVRP